MAFPFLDSRARLPPLSGASVTLSYLPIAYLPYFHPLSFSRHTSCDALQHLLAFSGSEGSPTDRLTSDHSWRYFNASLPSVAKKKGALEPGVGGIFDG
jgi:hypothetical protein